ncbi:RHS repeat domain-containing protein [Methylobacter sp. BBA5.1]|uniref:RHS repeat domain-containing protein n=1 Tax=Methylobacter sp. BBA5.1 TaxID=1495064 RepID=UPI00068D3C2C|nr:RHS repeat-associated core domain-containing protein [Methylobacter sp. BBA5.1]
MNLTARIFFLTLASILTSLPLPVQFISAANAAPAVNTYEYDPNGNLIKSTDPLGRIRQYQHDPLDQPVRQLEPHPTVVGSTQGQIDIGYDSLGQLTSVTDPRNLTTQYQVDSLGNLTSQISPDTGTTSFTYDAAGNVKTRTNARNKTAVYSYDSLNRITQAVYDSQTVTYSWDNCLNGIGRLCSLANNYDTVSYSYDSHGRITSKTQSVSMNTLTASYSYNTQGQWEQTVTPSGQTIGYVWLNGKIDAITVNGQTLISQIGYEPDGQINGWTWGNGQQHERFYDLVGRPVLASLGFNAAQLPNSRHYGYDAAGRLIQMTDDSNPGLNQQHDYDGLDRLTGSERGEPAQSRIDYSYDLNGNRTSKILDNATTYNYNISASNNRLQSQSGAQAVSYSYDKMGLLVSDGTHSYSYNPEGRRTSVIGVISYGYNALGQRVKKNVIGGPFTRYFYDEQSHLAGEYNASGQLLQEIVWLGDLPVAVLKPTVPVSATVDVYYIHADTLGTPRQISRPGDNKVVWAWESEAFGASLPDQNPSGLGTFVFNLRFPGQYYDAETGLHYNVFRDYDPRTGRYSQSDPIGLAGGLNTYIYVANNPLNLIDPDGLCPEGQAWKSKGQRGKCVPESEADYLPGNAAEDFLENCPLPQIKGIAAITAGITKVVKSVNWKSVKQFGHTFNTHGAGAKNTDRLADRARGTGNPQGQWKDNEKAAEFLNDTKTGVDGPASVQIPEGLGQVVMPDGSIVNATRATIVPGPDGIRTAYPIP